MVENFSKQELNSESIYLQRSNFQLLLCFLSRRDTIVLMNKPLDRGHEQKRFRMIEWLLTEPTELKLDSN